MIKPSTEHGETSVWAGRAALFLGAAFVLALGAELGLRATGALLGRAESRAYGGAGGEIRILCLGESTTASQFPTDYSWPALLQARLDEVPGRKFVIVNRGRRGIETSLIAERLPWLLDAERPQIVVTMMGVNDPWIGGLRVAPRPETLRLVRVWRWARREIGRTVWLAKLSRLARSSRPEDELRRRQACDDILASDLDFGGLDLCRPDPENPARNGSALRALPRDAASSQVDIAVFLHQSGDRAGFERHWQAAWESHPWDERLVRMRFDSLVEQKQYAQAGALARAMAAWRPKNALGHALLFEFAWEGLNGASLTAKDLREGETACRLSPDALFLHMQLANAYAAAGRYADADALVDSIRRRGGSARDWDLQQSNLIIARYYAKRGRMKEAAEVYFRSAAEEAAHRPTIEKFAERLLRAGRRDEAARLYDLLDGQTNSALGGVPSVSSAADEGTRENYQRIGGMLRARGIAWIAMQYPLRHLEALRRLTADFPEAVLVENRSNFLDAQQRVPAPALFLDRFAGDFGHCSREGNSLIAAAAEPAVRAAARATR